MLSVIKVTLQTFNKIAVYTSANGKSSNRSNKRRKANKRTEGSDSTTRGNKARKPVGNNFYGLRSHNAERKIYRLRKEKVSRGILWRGKELLQRYGTCTQTRSKERRVSFFPLFFFSDYRFVTILQAIDDFCLQINPTLIGAMIK